MTNLLSARRLRRSLVSLWRLALLAISLAAALPEATEAAQIVLTTGSSWTVPNDWNNFNNKIEVIGGGAGGSGANSTVKKGGGGGGAGAYATINNLALIPGASVTYGVGAGGPAGAVAGDGSSGGDSFFNGASGSTSSIWAIGGSHAAATSGGAGGSSQGFGTQLSGGSGGNGDTLAGPTHGGGGGGGGAAGPNSAGVSGVSTSTGAGGAGGHGGSGGGGAGGVGGSGTSTPGVGGNGTEFGSVGSGGGGGGGGSSSTSTVTQQTGAAGGNYGAGGGGGAYSDKSKVAAPGGAGAPGIIVITYTPVAVPPTPTQSGTRTSSFSYDASSGLLTQEVVEPDLTAYRLQTDYTYDANGNRISVAVSGSGITSRSASTGFDTKGQYALTSTNALSQSESFTYDARFGLPLSHTGPNGLPSSWTYDSFGRKTLETRADGTKTSWSYQFCAGVNGGTASCPTGGKYLTIVTPLAADGVTPNGPITTGYYDLFGRPIATDAQGFNGSIIRSATQYDALGRVSQKSRPYFVSGGTPAFEVYTYDTLGRRTQESYPDTTATLHAYHGLSQTDTNTLSQTQITVKDSQGQVVQVTDNQSHSTTYKFAPFGLLSKVTDAAGNITTYGYDQRGRKTTSSDPDMGAWSYSYNVLDQLVSQTDAKSQTTTITYDLLGRITQRSEADLVSNWTYDVGTKAIGKLSSVSTNGGYLRTHTYDSLGRPSTTQYTVGVNNYGFTTAYDSASRISTITYPSGTVVTYGYNGYGYQTTLTNTATSEVYWTANARDAEQHLLQQTAGNGVVTNQSFNANNGRLTAISAGASGAVASFSYTYDGLGQMTGRSDTNTGLNETFGHDSLNRLTSSVVNVTLTKSFTYDLLGNLTSKSDVGNYVYPTAGSLRPHAVSSISGTLNTTFSYDANGNELSGAGLNYVYTSYNKPHSISRGANTVMFGDDADHQRFQKFASAGTTTYLAASGAMAERFDGSGGSSQWTNYLVAGGELVSMRVEAGASITTRYFTKDHLGSIAVIADTAGVVQERLSYDVWGKRRFANGNDDPTGSITSQTTRGFTGHEELADVGLVHMNGRVYDPLLGRFGTADPTTENPLSTQGWNRYSYVGNSPINFADPSGYCFLGCFFQNVFGALQSLFRSIPILGNLLVIAAAAIASTFCGPVCVLAVASLTSAFVAGVTSGSLGAAFKAGLITAVTIVAFQGLGTVISDLASQGLSQAGQYFANMAGSAAINCITTVASGGKCGAAALSAAVTAAAMPLISTAPGGSLGRLATSSVVGGLASVAGGGKFGNGAMTAAFQYLVTTSSQEAQAKAAGGSGNPMDANAAMLDCMKASRMSDCMGGGGEGGGGYGPPPPGVFRSWYGGDGPLPAGISGLFRGGTYTELTLGEDTLLYRVYGGSAEELGAWWSRTQPVGPLQSQIDLGLEQSWGNTAQYVTTMKVPAGTTIYEGTAASQNGWLTGGGSQVYVPNAQKSWLK